MKKKVLMLTNKFDVASETFISDEAKFLSNNDLINLDILHYYKSIPHKNIHGLNLPLKLLKRWKNLPILFNFKVIKSLQFRNGLNGTLPYLINFFKRNQYDVIYCHFGTNGKLIAQMKHIGVIPAKTKLIIRFHGLDMNFSNYPIGYYNILSKYADKIIVGSTFALNNLMKYGFDSDKISIIPVGVSKKNLIRTDEINYQKKTPFEIITIGRLIPLKGFSEAINVMEILKNKFNIDFHYSIVGNGPLLENLKQQIKQSNLEKFITIHKYVPHTELLNLLKYSNLYLYPGIIDKNGRCEAQGLANIEAMASGLPIVASNVGGIPDYVIDNRTGYLSEQGNINDFAHKIKYVINNYDKSSISQIRRQAIKYVSEHYNQEHLNKKLLQLLIK